MLQMIRQAVNYLVRGFEAAKSHRLNKAHWSGAVGSTINQDIAGDWKTVRDRAEHESRNNPFVRGVIETHTTDVIGNGPSLQVQSSSRRYNNQLESAWSRFWEMPDFRDRLSGTDMLRLCHRSNWTNGEFILQLATDKSSLTGIQTRLVMINPTRLSSPLGLGNPNFFEGIEYDENGKVQTYHFRKQKGVPGFLDLGYEFEQVSRRNVLHNFSDIEVDQARGVPWLAPSLDTVSQLRDYDTSVLDSARFAASIAGYIFARAANLQPKPVNMMFPVQRGMVASLPPGYEPGQMDSKQPIANYGDFRGEKLRELGRPIGMPLMTVALDSSKHNFSSARFDGQNYNRSNMSLQGWYERSTLNRLLRVVEAEARFSGLIRVNRPEKVIHSWVWGQPPHVDPVKEAKAADMRLANSTSSQQIEAAAIGNDWEVILRHKAEFLKKKQEIEEEFGISFTGSEAATSDFGQDELTEEQREQVEEMVREAIQQMKVQAV